MQRPRVPGLYIKHGKYVYQPPQKNGHRPPPIHLSTADFHLAVAAVYDLQQRTRFATLACPLASHVADYFRAKLAGREHRPGGTARAAGPALKRFQAFFRVAPSQITAAGLQRWKESMGAEGLSNATIASYLSYAQSFLSWMVREDRLLRSPFAAAGGRRFFPRAIPTRRGRACTKAERDLLLAHCPDPDLLAVLYLGFHAGLRRNEILNVRPAWILRDPDTGRPTHIRVQNETGRDGTSPFVVKDGAEKIVPLTEPLIEFLLRHGIDRGPYIVRPKKRAGRHLYRWEWRAAWKSYVTSQGLPWVGVHTMRHTFVSLLLSAPPEVRPSLLHLERWTGTGVGVLKKTYAHLADDSKLINAAN